MARKQMIEGGTKNRIREVGGRQIFEHGYDGTSVRGIMLEVGGEVGLFYYYYKTKDELFTDVLDHFFEPYRKDFEALAAEAKEKIKSALLRGRNNYREVFVKDYQNWMKYESKGSYRLNKIAREILITYCPFAKPIREELKGNPMYESALHRLDLLNAKTVQRIQGVYDKYQKAGGRITQELTDNLEYYEL
mgnify:CR=1 FL=1